MNILYTIILFIFAIVFAKIIHLSLKEYKAEKNTYVKSTTLGAAVVAILAEILLIIGIIHFLIKIF